MFVCWMYRATVVSGKKTLTPSTGCNWFTTFGDLMVTSLCFEKLSKSHWNNGRQRTRATNFCFPSPPGWGAGPKASMVQNQGQHIAQLRVQFLEKHGELLPILHLEVSKNGGTPISSISGWVFQLFWGTPFMETPILLYQMN